LKNIGAAVEDDKRKVELPYYLGSLDKIKGEEKVIDKFKKTYSESYIISDKLDGNSGLFHLIKGNPKLYTRGDGTIGQDVSHILPFIQNIPDNLDKFKTELSVRGECIISRDAFEKVKHKGSNGRNMVAGVLNAKIPDMEIARASEFVAYELIVPKLPPDEQMEYMKKLGFKVVYHKVIEEDKLTNEELSKILVDRRTNSEYEVDGIVVMHNKLHRRVNNENPPYGFAFKSVHTMGKVEVIVNNIEWNLSKDGYLVPTVLFNAVNLMGVNIQKATGFNGKFINDNKLGPGSRIVIMRAGDVIPHVLEILTASETGEPQMPQIEYIWSKTGVDIMLSDENKKDNDELRYKNFENFFKKIDIVGFGPGNMKKMFDAGFNTVKKAFDAKPIDLLKIDGFKDKLATKIYENLQERLKTLDCLTIMDASNVMGRGIGSKKLDLILKEFPAILDKRYVPTLTELKELKGIEQTTATLFITNLPVFFKFIDDNDLDCMIKVNKKAAVEAAIEESPKFAGQKFVFSGIRNKALEEYITVRSGEIVGSVSKNTTAVICKDVDEDSGKIKKANELKIDVIQIDEFIKKNNITLGN
jgi:NAD-dependent DNA ligase